MIFWKRHWLHGLQQKGKQMFNQEHLSQIDKQYLTIQSRNTGHYWYLHCAGYPTEEALVIFHKHRFSHPYHQHGRANTLRQAIRSIQGHDKWLLSEKIQFKLSVKRVDVIIR